MSSTPLVVRASVAGSKAGVEVTLRLENVSAGPVFVNSRLALHAAHAPAPYREVSFEIEGPDGKARPFTSKVNRGQAAAGDVKELAPGKTLEQRYQIARDFDLAEAGKYRLRASYATSPVADSQGRAAWVGTAQSEWVTFTRN